MGTGHSAVEDMVVDPPFWKGRRVFLTGHTGFKGAWTSLLLGRLGAEVHGFALPPESGKGVFVAAGVERDVHHGVGDVRDFTQVRRAMERAAPEIVIHMAAQSLVRRSYREPVETYATNVIGTVHVLEAARGLDVRAIVVVTTDKCYENVGWDWGYREIDRLGGHDPYSNSKACAELVVDAYRHSFFGAAGGPAVASARAGNVIGGGDFAPDRLTVDAMSAFEAGEVLRIRSPAAVRPWQHVLDPVTGYLQLADRLVRQGREFAGAWNFGPDPASEVPVATVADRLAALWGNGARWEQDRGEHPHEASRLALDCAKARNRLGWRPMIDLDTGLRLTVAWYKALHDGADMREMTRRQIEEFLDIATN
jgi:CDP-glucose 4,6-dehydratase